MSSITIESGQIKIECLNHPDEVYIYFSGGYMVWNRFAEPLYIKSCGDQFLLNSLASVAALREWVDVINKLLQATKRSEDHKEYNFRAECIADVNRFKEVLGINGRSYTITSKPYDFESGPAFGVDVDVTLKTEMEMNEVKQLMSQVVDSHVMIRTLKKV